MTEIAVWDHRDLHPRGRDTYRDPTFQGYPEEGDEVRVVYRSKRTGDLTDRVATISSVYDSSSYGGGTTHPSRFELTLDDGSGNDLRVWGGGGYDSEKADVDGYAPAQVWTRSLVADGHGGRSWRDTVLGRLVRLEAPRGAEFTVRVENLPSDRLDGLEDALEDAVYQKLRRDSTGQDLVDVTIDDVDEIGRTD